MFAFWAGTKQEILDAVDDVGTTRLRVAESHGVSGLLRRHVFPVNGTVGGLHSRLKVADHIGVAAAAQQIRGAGAT